MCCSIAGLLIQLGLSLSPNDIDSGREKVAKAINRSRFSPDFHPWSKFIRARAEWMHSTSHLQKRAFYLC